MSSLSISKWLPLGLMYALHDTQSPSRSFGISVVLVVTPYGRSGFQCSSTNPKPFAIVYYAENKKRLVPMDSIEKVER